MVDIHSHILYGLDDGAGDLDESIAMVNLAAEQGTTDIVATPHANHAYRFQPGLIAARIGEIQAAVGDRIRIHTGCDFHLSFDNIQDALETPSKYTIDHGRYLLVEFSDLLVPKTTGDVFADMQARGIVPIVTHPERNPILQRKIDLLAQWVDSGITMQVTALSLAGRFGKTAKAAADQLMKRNLVHFIASDAHDTEHRPPGMRDAYAEVAGEFGEARARALFIDNPRAAIDSGEVRLPEAEPRATAKKWFPFW